jgi:hypothetical protein
VTEQQLRERNPEAYRNQQRYGNLETRAGGR